MTLSKRPRGTRSSPGLPTPLFAARRPKSRHAASADGAAPAPERAPEQRHELIGTLARNVTARLDLKDVLAATFAELRVLVRFGGGSIQLVDDEGWIRLAAADPAVSDERYDVRIPLHSTVPGRVVLTERPIYLPDMDSDGIVSHFPPMPNPSARGVRSYFGVPLLAEGRAIGLLQIDSPEPAAWDETERMLLVCISPVVASAIQNARAHARVLAMQRNTSRMLDRWRVMTELLETDIDVSVRRLVALAESFPSLREEVDRLTARVACLRAVAAAEHDGASRTSVDLRAAEKSRI